MEQADGSQGSRKARHNARVRSRIRAAAADRFRRFGLDGTPLNALMEDAGLTRGAFYAHFPSKQALVVEVLEEEQPLLALLRGRSIATPDALWMGLRRILADYLDPRHRQAVASGCTLIALARDAATNGAEARAAFGRAVSAVRAEMGRGADPTASDATLTSVLSITVGAHVLAAATEDDDAADAILAAAGTTVGALLDGLSRPDCPPARTQAGRDAPAGTTRDAKTRDDGQ